ncbi:hypothetical protein EGR_08846 [Echinococcus granulosus]|uniref:Protein HGH1 C-terminal domain-containing protein n=1 Tax=Echinococcus granulosus TaxID=6210 RepID=W6U7G4_ECHGR|nr:hypothetical protein EGR_08846 [Echinococcus granulosus]EUB56301.1 hypothetical protein EGR_08846 [Echinococcus granulosus]
MERTELLESLLEVSTNEYYAHQLKDELGRYFNVMTGVVVESANLLSPQNLECHGRLCYLSDDMLVTALLVLCDVSDAIEDEDRCTLPPPIREAYDSKTAKRESDALVKTTICEALLQLCSTKTGRQYLRSLGVYFILREMHRHECAVEQNLVGIEGGNELQTQKNLVFVVDQVVDQLICEESERPKDYSSLRDVPIDKETEEKLNKAKVAYINST